jgi:hypothetical protein
MKLTEPFERQDYEQPPTDPVTTTQTPQAFPRLAVATETYPCAPSTSFEAILDAYEKDPERWDGLE